MSDRLSPETLPEIRQLAGNVRARYCEAGTDSHVYELARYTEHLLAEVKRLRADCQGYAGTLHDIASDRDNTMKCLEAAVAETKRLRAQLDLARVMCSRPPGACLPKENTR